MNLRFFRTWPAGALFAAWLLAGCASIDTTPMGRPDRVLTGTVAPSGPLPAGTEILVRLVAPPAAVARAPGADRPAGALPAWEGGERVLGESRQTLAQGSSQPVPFRLEYHADDAQLRRGLSVDVRVSEGGRVRFRTIQAHVLTLASSPYPQEVRVQPVQ